MTMIFGILNITEDSFSDGGKFLDPQAAEAQAHLLHGAEDIGQTVGGRPDIRTPTNVIDLPADTELSGVAVSPSEIDARAGPLQHTLRNAVLIAVDVEGLPQDASMGRDE